MLTGLDADGEAELATNNGVLTIPESLVIDGVSRHVGIADSAFSGNTEITAIKLYDSSYDCDCWTLICGANAFSGCTNLENIYSAYDKDDSTVEGYGLLELTGNSVFEGCTSLVTVVAPVAEFSDVTNTFKDCTGLRIVTLQPYVGDMPTNFAGCTSLVLIDFNGMLYDWNRMTRYDSMVGKAIVMRNSSNRVLTSGRIVDTSYYGSIDTLTAVLDGYAFADEITKVYLRDDITTVEDDVFAECVNLEEVLYRGYESDRNAMTVGTGNETFTSASWRYGVVALGS